jgi:hypothetical protein
MTDLTILALIVTTGLLVSLNPFSISVFGALLAGARGKAHSKNKTHLTALAYLSSYYLLISGLGITLISLFSVVSDTSLIVASVASAALAIIMGIIIAKNYFWYRIRSDIPSGIVTILHQRTVKKNDPLSSISLGLNSAVFCLTIIGSLLLTLAAITVLTGTSFSIWFMLLFAFCLITPLIFIYLFVTRGLKISAVLKWKEESKGVMRLSIGLVHLILGWLVLLLLNGTIGSVL